eukprot:m.150663 g.150663  ORF g.150663 m.150663 type:complete len:202 (+) comp15029_c0_seq2:1719-2324(+)
MVVSWVIPIDKQVEDAVQKQAQGLTQTQGVSWSVDYFYYTAATKRGSQEWGSGDSKGPKGKHLVLIKLSDHEWHYCCDLTTENVLRVSKEFEDILETMGGVYKMNKTFRITGQAYHGKDCSIKVGLLADQRGSQKVGVLEVNYYPCNFEAGCAGLLQEIAETLLPVEARSGIPTQTGNREAFRNESCIHRYVTIAKEKKIL